MAKKNKSKSKNASLIAIIVLISIVCVISIAYNFLGGFYQDRVSKYNIMLGEKQVINLTHSGAFVASANFSGTMVLGTNIKQNIVLQNSFGTLYLRAKVSLCEKEFCGIIFGYTNWIQNDDGYIYLNQPMLENEIIGLCEYVKIDDNDIKLQGDKNYIINFVVEASSEAFI